MKRDNQNHCGYYEIWVEFLSGGYGCNSGSCYDGQLWSRRKKNLIKIGKFQWEKRWDGTK